tara:strand:- start:7769 stop:8785 length:1017 start_codon:yes stop_codon:yes gene_type:complete
MKLTKTKLKQIIKEELEGLSETDVIDDFLSAPVGEESSELTEGQMELLFGLQNFEMIAAIAIGIVGAVPVITTMYLAEKIANFLEDRRIDAREAARAARKKAEEEQAEAELVLLTDFLLEDPTFVAALDGLVTSGSRKDVIAFNKSVRGKIKELGSMMNTSPAVLLKRLRKKAGAGDIEQRVVSDFEEKVSSANPEQDAEALRKAEPASLPSRQRQKIKESIKGIKKMKLTKTKLKQIIKEEIALGKRLGRAGKAFVDEIPDSEEAWDRESMIFQKKLYELITDRLGPSKDTAVEMGFLIADVAQLAGAYFGEDMKAAFDQQNERGVYDELKRELGIK